MFDYSGWVIAVDFDGTIVKWARFPDIGEPVPLALETLKHLQVNGARLVLNTVRDADALDKAVTFLKSEGIVLFGVNKLPGQTEYSTSPKINAEVFIDDKGFGCPLIFPEDKTERPFVDWTAVRASFDIRGNS